jgi:lysozyme
MNQELSASGQVALEAREGCRLIAYHDQRGILTIGIGHTSMAGAPTVTAGMTITRTEASAIFARDLKPFVAAVNRSLRRRVSQNQFDACVSLCYNIGEGGFAGSSVVKQINLGNMAAAARDFLMWDHPASLAARREAERAQFERPDSAVPIAAPRAPTAPVPVTRSQPAPPKPSLWSRLRRFLTVGLE